MDRDSYLQQKISIAWVKSQEAVTEVSHVLGPHFREFVGKETGTKYKIRANGDIEVTKIVKHEDLELKN